MATTEIQPQAGNEARRERDSMKTLRALLRRLRTGSLSKSNKRISQSKLAAVQIPIAASEKEPAVTTITTLDRPTPKTQRALTVPRKGEYEVVEDHPVPDVLENEVLIKSRFVGLNPIDWKTVDYNFCMPAFPWVNGREMSGTVERVGSAVTHVKPGDAVWTSTYYRDSRAGCFQDYVLVPQHTVVPIPACVPAENAATLGVPALTAAMTLWKWLGVPMPVKKSPAQIDSAYASDSSDSEGRDTRKWILIWGGAAVTGQYLTQLAALSGLRVVTVCSAETRALSLALGAEAAVARCGRSEEELLAEIKAVTGGAEITLAVDLVGGATAAQGLKAVSKVEPVQFAPLNFMNKGQEVPENVTAHTVEMKRYVLDESAVVYSDELNRLLAGGEIVLPEIHVVEGGLDAVPGALDVLKNGSMKGKKLVVRLAE